MPWCFASASLLASVGVRLANDQPLCPALPTWWCVLFWAGMVDVQHIPLVGASGAIAGILGAFCVRLWKTDIRFAYFFMFGFRPFFGTFHAKAWLMLPLWFANEVFQAYLMKSLGVSDGVAYWAHVGGFMFGAADWNSISPRGSASG